MRRLTRVVFSKRGQSRQHFFDRPTALREFDGAVVVIEATNGAIDAEAPDMLREIIREQRSIDVDNRDEDNVRFAVPKVDSIPALENSERDRVFIRNLCALCAHFCTTDFQSVAGRSRRTGSPSYGCGHAALGQRMIGESWLWRGFSTSANSSDSAEKRIVKLPADRNRGRHCSTEIRG
jgi:hypothetical protein